MHDIFSYGLVFMPASGYMSQDCVADNLFQKFCALGFGRRRRHLVHQRGYHRHVPYRGIFCISSAPYLPGAEVYPFLHLCSIIGAYYDQAMQEGALNAPNHGMARYHPALDVYGRSPVVDRDILYAKAFESKRYLLRVVSAHVLVVPESAVARHHDGISKYVRARLHMR